MRDALCVTVDQKQGNSLLRSILFTTGASDQNEFVRTMAVQDKGLSAIDNIVVALGNCPGSYASGAVEV